MIQTPTLPSLDDLPAPPFHTERLLLRPYAGSDAGTVHAVLDLDPEVWRHDPGHERSLDERREVIATFAALHRQFGFGPCGAWRRSDGAFVGQSGLSPHLFEHQDGQRLVEFEVMYKVAQPFWRQGLAGEMAAFWADFAFRTVGLGRLVTCIDRDNAASIATQRRLGAVIVDDWLDSTGMVATLTAPG